MKLEKLKIFLAGIGAAVVFIAGWLLRGLFCEKTAPVSAGKIPEEVKLEVQRAIADTPARDIIAAADNTDELRANADRIAEQSKQRLRDRTKSILSGHSGSGTDSGGGS